MPPVDSSSLQHIELNWRRFSAILPPERIWQRSDDNSAQFDAYSCDRTRFALPDASLILFPESLEELVEVVRLAQSESIPLVPSGGRTGYAGGAVARRQEVVVAMERLNRLLDYDSDIPSLRVEAGMTTGELQRLATERGHYFAFDHAASGSSQIGGNIATNAGGLRVVRYGMIREQLLGLRVVTGRGQVIEFNGNIVKQNCGYDLKQLFIGSEGSLGFIVDATLRLHAPPPPRQLFLLALADFAALRLAIQAIRQAGGDLYACEFFDEIALTLVIERQGLPRPLTAAPWYLLFEVDSGRDDAALEAFCEKLFESLAERLVDSLLVEDSTTSRAAEIWRYRESISEALSLSGLVHKNDLSLPPRNMDGFFDFTQQLAARIFADRAQIVYFGHIGDGNIHLNLLLPRESDRGEALRLCRQFDEESYREVVLRGGSISAEHGIGLLKRDALPMVRSPLELTLMRRIKSELDPAGVFNPGKLLRG